MRILVYIFLLLLILHPLHAIAQIDDGWKIWNRLYNKSTERVVEGKVVDVGRLPDTKDRAYGIRLLIRIDSETIPVHLGPAWFVHNQGFSFEAGDRVEVKGSMVRFRGDSLFVAAELTKEGRILKLRDEKGFPYWTWKR